jgi:hypothetical protein
MISFKEFLSNNNDEDGVDYFVIEMLIEDNFELIDLNESHWKDSGKKGYMLRIDPENSAMKQKRHVHIAKSKHINSKSMQASWNSDKTRHDRKSFNSNVGSINAVQSIAREALGLPSDAILESLEKNTSLKLIDLCESLNEKSLEFKAEYFVLK